MGADENPSADAEQRVSSIVDDVLRRRCAGEDISDEAILAAHPELANELQRALNKARLVAAAAERAKAPPSRLSTVAHEPGGKTPRGLQICCPHCSNFVEVITDTPYEEICCSTCGSSFSLVTRDEATRMSSPLKSIGRFDLISRVGLGGFGTVWKARDRELDRTVAVKIPRRGQLLPAEIDQFFREARAAAQLKHPNIVPVHEVGRDGETIFIVSELVRGVSLSDWRSGPRREMREIARFCISIAAALGHAHEHGIVHRDLKPSNVLIDEEGQPHLTDFGLAKREVGEITMTLDGQILGTPAYMSPEQAAGKAHWTDRRTDIYSLGIVLFELLTGELPFRGNARMQVHQRLTEDAPDPRKLNQHIPRDLVTICLKCLEREPGRRYQTAQELGEELSRFAEGVPIKARAITPIERVIRWAGRRPLHATLAGLIVFLAIAGPTAAIAYRRQNHQLQLERTENANQTVKRQEEFVAASKRSGDLQHHLDVWEGRANPWSLWPPDSAKPPLVQQLASLISARKTVLESAAANETELDRARRLLALGITYDAMKRSEDAFRSLSAASEALAAALKKQPNDLTISLALADCFDRLSALTSARSSDESKQWLAKSLELRRSLCQEHPGEALAQALRLDTEMRTYASQGFDKAEGTKQLLAATELDAQLATLWPTSTSELYRLVCLLAGRAPWVADTGAGAPPPKPREVAP